MAATGVESFAGNFVEFLYHASDQPKRSNRCTKKVNPWLAAFPGSAETERQDAGNPLRP